MAKGIVLAGGLGTRLRPLTKAINKNVLPVYNKPLIYYPITTLKNAGITEILIISGRKHVGQILDLFGSGRDYGVKLSYEIEEEPKGPAYTFGLAEDFADSGRIALIFGDNIYEDDFSGVVRDFNRQDKGAWVVLKQVHDPERFGVAKFDEKNPDRIAEIIEKPKNPPTNWAVTGLYFYDERVWEVIKGLKPSARGEYEITDVNNFYVKEGTMRYVKTQGEWIDAGTFDALLRANNFMAKKEAEKNSQ